MKGALDRDCPSTSWAPDQVRRRTWGGAVVWTGRRGACHVRARALPDTSFPRRREPTLTRPIPVPEEAGWRVAATGTAITWVGASRERAREMSRTPAWAI